MSDYNEWLDNFVEVDKNDPIRKVKEAIPWVSTPEQFSPYGIGYWITPVRPPTESDEPVIIESPPAPENA